MLTFLKASTKLSVILSPYIQPRSNNPRTRIKLVQIETKISCCFSHILHQHMSKVKYQSARVSMRAWRTGEWIAVVGGGFHTCWGDMHRCSGREGGYRHWGRKELLINSLRGDRIPPRDVAARGKGDNFTNI